MVDLQELNYKDKIFIDDNVIIPEDYYKKMDIVSMNEVNVSGLITCDIEKNYQIDLLVKGEMFLHDSITYEIIPYKFDIKIEETLENSIKTLDLIEFLWHYIVLEVPLRLTNSEIDSFEGNNYRIISEEEYNKKNNPFSDFELK